MQLYKAVNKFMDKEEFKSKLMKIGKVEVVDNLNKGRGNRPLLGDGTIIFELDKTRTCERCGKQTDKNTHYEMRRNKTHWSIKCGACKRQFRKID